MTEDRLEIDPAGEPESLQPLTRPGFPVRSLAPVSRDRIILAGRRVVIQATPVEGVSRVTIDGQEAAVQSLGEEARLPSPHPTLVEVGIDRLYRRWAHGSDAFEELWIVPLTLPFALRRWRWGDRSGASIVWSIPEDEAAASRVRRIASTWGAVDRSWARDMSEAATFAGPAPLEETWAWSKARLLGAVNTGSDRARVRAAFDDDAPGPVEAAWVALGLCALGRSDLGGDAIRKIRDLNIRARTAAWVNRWAGNSGPHPDELAELFPESMELPGRTDTPLNAPMSWNDLTPVSAAAFCGKVIDQGLGIRPDSRFGRVRFGPFQRLLSPTPQTPVALTGLSVGQGRGSKRLDLRWNVEAPVGGEVRHTFQISPDAGATPLQGVFEPRLKAKEFRSVWLDGNEVRAEVTQPEEGVICARLQCPLDMTRTVSVVIGV